MVVHNIQSLAPQPITQLVDSISHSGFHFFGPHMVHKPGKQFAEDAHVNHGDSSWLQTLATNFYYTNIQVLMSRWDRCLDFYGDHVEVWCVSSVPHVPSIH